MDELKLIIASNIIRLRTALNMTQAELGEKINYSDKTVSKWERAESTPDIFVLKQLSEIFDVTVEFLITSHDKWEGEAEKKKNKTPSVYTLITLITMLGIFTCSLLVFTIFWMLDVYDWRIFVYAVPVMLVVLLVLHSLWGEGKRNRSIVFFLVLSIAAVVYVMLLPYNLWQIFILLIPVELIVLLSFNIRKSRKH